MDDGSARDGDHEQDDAQQQPEHVGLPPWWVRTRLGLPGTRTRPNTRQLRGQRAISSVSASPTASTLWIESSFIPSCREWPGYDQSIRSTAGSPARRNGEWSSMIDVPPSPGKYEPKPAARAAARRRLHSEIVEAPSRGSLRPRPAT